MNSETNWVPDACTLPTAEQPLRIAEFTALFATALLNVDRLAPTRLRLSLDASARDEAARLAEAESSCCSFFTFAIGDPVDGQVAVDVGVPATHVDVLDGLAEQATATARS